MAIPFIEGLRQRAEEPMSQRGLERLVGFALIVWVFGQILFSYSTFAHIGRVESWNISKFHQAIAAGCLIAVLANKGFSPRPITLVGLFCALFAMLTIWRRGGDARPIILLLFIIASSDMDITHLARCHALATLAGVVAVVGVAAIGKADNNASMVDGALTMAYGFDRPSTFAFIIVGFVGAVYLGWQELNRLPLAGVCVLGCVVCIAALHTIHVGVALIALGAFAIADLLCPDKVRMLTGSNAFRWVMAALPLVLFIALNDGTKFYGFAKTSGAYAQAVATYGYLAIACLVAAYLLTVISDRNASVGIAGAAFVIVYSLLLITDMNPLYLEFNVYLLLLGQGISGVLMAGESDDAFESVAKDVCPSTETCDMMPRSDGEM